MNNIILSFLITSIAGFATILGTIPCFFKTKNKESLIASTLSFASGIMLTISLISLIPESSNLLSSIYKPTIAFLITAIAIIFGIYISSLIDEKIEKKLNSSKLYKLGLISALALMLHNIPEGITTFISTNTNQNLGIKLALAIALHNIPEGISIAIPIYYATKNRKKAFAYTVIAGFSELLGAILAYIFLQRIINEIILGIILAITAGIMIDIAIYEYLPNSYQYKKNKAIIFFFVLGILIMYLSELYLF